MARAEEHKQSEILCKVFSCEKIYDAKKLISLLKKTNGFEISYVSSGEGILSVFNREIPCKRGDICILPPDTPHGFFLAEAEHVLTVRQLCFASDGWLEGTLSDPESSDYCYGAFNDNRFIAYATLNSAMQERICSLYDSIECEILEKKERWEDLIRGYLAALLINVSRYVNSAVKSVSFVCAKEWNNVTMAMNILKSELDDPTLTLDYVASKLYISPSRLSRSFKSLTGASFSDHLRTERMRIASKLLAKTNMNVELIAKNCGFRDIPTFYKNFRTTFNTSPREYREAELLASKEKQKNYILNGEKIMSILNDISTNVQAGKAKIVKELVQQALDQGASAADILNEGLLSGMNVIGEKFKNNEVYVPEVLVAARAMNMGTQILKPYLAEAGVSASGKVCIGTVQGDLHDIGKNLVKMMMEGKGLEVIDLGTDVSAEDFVKTAIEQNCQVICCSALLTTTMGVMGDVVKAAEAAGIRDKVKIMVGGAPVNDEFCKSIGADCYTVDAASAADAAVVFCKN